MLPDLIVCKYQQRGILNIKSIKVKHGDISGIHRGILNNKAYKIKNPGQECPGMLLTYETRKGV